MSDLAPQKINLSFGGLLQVPGGLTSSLQAITDGNGVASGLEISTTGFSGAVISDTVTITGGTINGTAIGAINPSSGRFSSLTVSTLTGLLKGSSGVVSAATANTDYLTPPFGTAILKANAGGALANATSGVDYAPATSGTSILKGDNAGGFSAAVAGTDYAGLASANTFTNNQVISVNSSSDALRITQTGAGNALVVEDSANPDATPFVVTKDGYVGIGTTSPTTGLSIVQDGLCQFNFIRNSDNVAPPYFVNIKRRGTEASKVIVNNNDQALSIQAYGYDGTADRALAYIDAFVDGTPGTNDMPGRLVFSTTADGASSPTERMRIDNTGAVGIGSTSLGAAYGLRIGKTLSGTTVYAEYVGGIADSSVTSWYQINTGNATASNGGTPYTVTGSYHYAATQGTFNADSTVTSQYGFFANNNLTGATNNIGFYSNIASGTGRYNFYAAGTAINYFAGAVGIGSVPVTGSVLYIGANSTGATTTSGVRFNQTVLSDVTGSFRGVQTGFNTQGNAFTLSNLIHMYATQGTFNSPSVVTNQYGYFAESTLTGATNNYGFYSNIASGTGRYNFYAAGSASNYLGGDLTFKPLASATPANNGDLTFEATSNTSVKIKLKGSDGVVRSVTLTLA